MPLLACEHLLYILRLPSCRLSSRNAFLTSSAASERSQIQIFRPCFCPFDRSRNLIRKLRCAAVLHTSIFRPTRHPSTRHPSCRSVTLFSAPVPDGGSGAAGDTAAQLLSHRLHRRSRRPAFARPSVFVNHTTL
jgi:hypothetical protein